MRRTQTVPDLDRFRIILKAKGLKATPQRVAVHEAMLALGHSGADAVRDWILQNRSVRITAPSVYNILTQLCSIGLYRQFPSMGSRMFFDINTYPHLHIYDRRNDEYKDVQDKELMGMINSYFKERKYKGYRVDDIEVQLICRPARNSKKKQQ